MANAKCPEDIRKAIYFPAFKNEVVWIFETTEV